MSAFPRPPGTSESPEVYSAGEIARAAGVRPRDVRALAEAGAIHAIGGGSYFSTAEAVAAVRALSTVDRPIFQNGGRTRRKAGVPLALSGTLHAGMAALIAALTSVGVARTQARTRAEDTQPLRMVYLVAPGPGGGGGGGGLKQPTPPPPAQRRGVERLRSPVPVRRPPPRIDPPPAPRPEPPPVMKAEAMPPVFAPVVAVAADPRDRAGLPWRPSAAADSHGPGSGGGTGAGRGTGLGDGDGAGIGAGSGGGTGGGPYRPGSGIAAPSILREVTPDYTDEGRRLGVEGDVVLEIVVRADGSVGGVKVLQGLGAGLDQRAAEAVRQWRFNPARRLGTPVDVIVEVAVEFKLR